MKCLPVAVEKSGKNTQSHFKRIIEKNAAMDKWLRFYAVEIKTPESAPGRSKDIDDKGTNKKVPNGSRLSKIKTRLL